MSALVDFQIADLCSIPFPEEGSGEPYPMVYPYDRKYLNPVSLDVRLGTFIQRSKEHRVLRELRTHSVQDTYSAVVLPSAKQRWIEREWEVIDISACTENKPFWLKHNELVLGMTKETFYLPDDIYALFYVKSSRAREGIEHSHATLCDPNWHGSVLTLELTNLDPNVEQPLYPNLCLGHMMFHRTEEKPRYVNYADVGHYNNDTMAQPSKGVFE